MLQFEFFDNSIPKDKLVTLPNEAEEYLNPLENDELEFEEIQENISAPEPESSLEPKPQLSKNAIVEFDFKNFVQQNWFVALMVLCFFQLMFSKNIDFHLSMASNENNSTHTKLTNQRIAESANSQNNGSERTAFSLLNLWSKDTKSDKNILPPVSKSKPNTMSPSSNAANNFANISVIMADNLEDKYGMSKTELADKQLVCANYVKRFSGVAQAEMKRYGIPASITLAQALLESDAGGSRLARKNNNHFGIKCFSKNCKKGHCSNFTDDTHKDFFRKYTNAWESFRAHSKLLRNKRYQSLQLLGTKNYKAWADGLQKAGYATDKKYAKKLIKIIERMELWRLDA